MIITCEEEIKEFIMGNMIRLFGQKLVWWRKMKLALLGEQMCWCSVISLECEGWIDKKKLNK